jgi:hypothetical protein
LLEPDLFKQKKAELAAFDFSAIVDNRVLTKPVLLPSGSLYREQSLESGYDYYVETFGQDTEVDGDRLRYTGYIYWQRKQVELSAVRGVQVYIRNVGIGPYDQTLMGFARVNPSSRVGQISSEIFVEEGLERALNVDRNSFRETDAHYRALQAHLWQLLGSTKRSHGVMGISVDAYWKRRERREENALSQQAEAIGKQVRRASGGKLSVEFLDEENPEPYTLKGQRVAVSECVNHCETTRFRI